MTPRRSVRGANPGLFVTVRSLATTQTRVNEWPYVRGGIGEGLGGERERERERERRESVLSTLFLVFRSFVIRFLVCVYLFSLFLLYYFFIVIIIWSVYLLIP